MNLDRQQSAAIIRLFESQDGQEYLALLDAKIADMTNALVRRNDPVDIYRAQGEIAAYRWTRDLINDAQQVLAAEGDSVGVL